MSPAFDVLTLPLRQDILAALRHGPALVGDLAERLGAPQAAVSKQLRVLREAGFVRARVDAQRRWYELCPQPFVEMAQWLEPYRWMWEDRLDKLGGTLERIKESEQS
ncbi:ArsR family transcriptional regulator [Occultella glacieicola]|uniref:ArsR family transcriptional regulator n=1 Tax=Occultella glacieicola TaxID=2518684 RepID=A0ABY2E2F0_9MICO|nr:metalloregulator ArsR/SmtB family transcription factor [Occultella glacieicola]TDE92751.1 ArsR family transcriptional regulator [Occultella glacieicola]